MDALQHLARPAGSSSLALVRRGAALACFFGFHRWRPVTEFAGGGQYVYGCECERCGGTKLMAGGLPCAPSEAAAKARRAAQQWASARTGITPAAIPVWWACVALLIALLPLAAHAHPPGSPWAAWFMAQKIPDGREVSCCSEADAHLLEDNEWRVREGEYEVLVLGAWTVFPNKGEGKPGNRVLGPTGNPTGHAVAFYGSAGTPYCFVPGVQG